MTSSAQPKQEEDLEAAQPLLAKAEKGKHAYDSIFDTGGEEDYTPHIEDPMTYRLAWLKGWGVFTISKQTVWDNPALWRIMTRLLLLSLVMTVIAYNFIPDPSLLNVAKFSEMNAVLSGFVTLMLSFFLSSAVSRWVSCVSGLYSMFNSIKNYGMQLHALGVDHERIHLAMRYCVLSAHFLIHELRSLKIHAERKKKANQLLWEKLESGASEYAKVDEEERKVLELVAEKSAQMWIWVATHLGRMAADGDVPPMASPTYGRLMNLIQAAQEGQRETRIAILVQMPLVYLHTLAYLVHVNSILFAIITGISFGCSLHGIRKHTYTLDSMGQMNQKTVMSTISMTEHLQMLLVQGVTGFLAPLLIQAFLQIALSIVQPFNDEDAAIPSGKLLQDLENDLLDAFIIASRPQKFKMAHFKKPPEPPAEKPVTK
mmetsp:Transcript_23783/g.40692  ORF Transcript_23783/g.40692 Transcript_23783/m.40692 type:complete len:429 (-) Transcript_23783:142-1428(-)